MEAFITTGFVFRMILLALMAVAFLAEYRSALKREDLIRLKDQRIDKLQEVIQAQEQIIDLYKDGQPRDRQETKAKGPII